MSPASSSTPSGPSPVHTARPFAANLFAAGGITTVPTRGRPIAILASSRSGYAERPAPPRSPPCRGRRGTLIVAGRANDLQGDAAGAVDGDVHDGIDVVAFLSTCSTARPRSADPPISTPRRKGRDERRARLHQPSTRRRAPRPSTPRRLRAGPGEPWHTPEGIDVKPLYTAADLDGLDFLDTYPGLAAVPARPVPDDVRQPAVDDPPVRRVLHRRGLATRSTAATSPPARRACRSRSTSRPTAATTATTRA